MKWIKLGQVFVPANNKPWMKTHAANTVAEHICDDIFRVYFSCRNDNNVSSIGYADIGIKPPFKVIGISDEPVLSPGDIGTFDDSGVSLSCIININDKKYLYYLGWNLGITVPWRNSIGLAIYNKRKQRFEKFSRAPIMDRCDIDPFSLSYPFILKEKNVLKMWYGSNLKWGRDQKDMNHVIKYAESEDGIYWERSGAISLNFSCDKEYAISRPYVIKEDDMYKMWYSYRGGKTDFYRIGYAESSDGIYFKRKDEKVGIDVSENGWDSEMICYPHVFCHKGRQYMLYNGNKYGKTGFGLAVLDKE